MTLHFIGDSHSKAGWWNIGRMIKAGIIKCKQPFHIQNHRMATCLAYSFGRDGLSRCDITEGRYVTTNHKKQSRVYNHDFQIRDGDSVCFVLGEPDCRCHLHKYVSRDNSANEIITKMIPAYYDAIKQNVDKLNAKLTTDTKKHGNMRNGHINVYVQFVVPPMKQYGKRFPYPVLGTCKDRLNYVRTFNTLARKLSRKYNYRFINLYNEYSDKEGYMLREKSDGLLHIGDSDEALAPLINYLKRERFIL